MKCDPNNHQYKLIYAPGTNKVSHRECAICFYIEDSKCLRCGFDKRTAYTLVDDDKIINERKSLCDDCRKWVGDNLIAEKFQSTLIESPLSGGKSVPTTEGPVFRWSGTQHLICNSCNEKSSFNWIHGQGYKCDKCGATQELKIKDIFPEEEKVNHPKHYNNHPSGIECITIIESMPFNVGSAIKYLWRAGLKDGAPTIEDYKKSIWYIEREIQRLSKDVKES